jgi:hypothetical protein
MLLTRRTCFLERVANERRTHVHPAARVVFAGALHALTGGGIADGFAGDVLAIVIAGAFDAFAGVALRGGRGRAIS